MRAKDKDFRNMVMDPYMNMVDDPYLYNNCCGGAMNAVEDGEAMPEPAVPNLPSQTTIQKYVPLAIVAVAGYFFAKMVIFKK